MFALRPYQEEAKQAVYHHLRECDDNPCVVIPTAGGKTPVIASICKDAVGQWGGRVLILAHVKELLEQAADKLRTICPEIPLGVYSAGLKRRDTSQAVIIAGIQSIFRRACDLDAFDLIIIDEAHMIAPEGDGMYRQFLAEAKVVNPHLRIIGFTATPFRMKTGTICTPDGFLNSICYEIGVRELICDGYLCPLVSKAGRAKADVSNLHIRGGEFVAGELEDLMDQDGLVHSACAEIVSLTNDRRACLIFTSGIRHGEHVAKIVSEMSGKECGFVSGETPVGERNRLLDRFRQGDMKYLSNVNVLTTGFDAPNIDCVALLRPTLSPGLYCLDSQTEILTDTGWKGIGSIQVGDKVAAFDTKDESIQYLPALATIERNTYANESFISLETPGSSIRVTDLHRLVTSSKGKSKWRFTTALQASSRRNGVAIPKAGYLSTSGVPLSDDELRFIGWVMTFGNINKSTNAICIVQSTRQPGDRELQRVVQSCGFKHSISMQHCKTKFRNSSTMRHWTIPKGKPRGRDRHLRGWGVLEPWISKDFSEKLLENIDARQFAVLLEAIHLGDGAKQVNQDWTRRSYHISTGNALFAERLQIGAITRGFRCTLSRQHYNQNPLWIVHIKNRSRAWVASKYDSRPSWEFEGHKNERVWCVENDLGTLITRRNGKVTILGNCQMVGRGFRLSPRKTDCLVLDFGGNVLRHGPVDDIRLQDPKTRGDGEAPAKECPQCQAVVAAGYARCPQCGFEFPPPEKQKHGAKASEEGILSGQVASTKYDVYDVFYSVHTKRNADESAPKTMRVDYKIGFHQFKSEWICFEHEGYALQKAVAWWRKRSLDPVPERVEQAVDIANAGGLACPKSITVRSVAGDPYDRIVDYVLGPMPEAVVIGNNNLGYSADEIPF